MENVNEISNVNDSIIFRDTDIYAIQKRVNAFEAMFATAGEAFVVSGCVVSGTAPNNAVSAGIAFIDGKLHRLPAVASVDLGTTKYIKFSSSADSDPRSLSGGGTQNRIKTYLAQVSNTASTFPLQSIPISQATPARKFSDVFAKKSDLDALFTLDAPQLLTINTGYEAGFVTLSPYYRKNKFNEVALTGTIKRTTGGAGIVCVLPVGFRPPQNKHFVVWNQAQDAFGVIRVDTAGQIVVATSVTTGDVWWLDAIRFYTDM
jgi:hypothetical protein